METLTIDLKKKKSFEIGQQGDHNALCIHFINMKNVGTNKKYIYYTIDGIENCVPLTNDRFIVGYPLTAHSGIASAQLISKLNDNSIIKLSNVFAMNIKESKGYKDSGKYPVDPNIQSSYDLLDDLIDQTQDLINNYNYATLMEKLTQASSEATTSAATAKKCADELKSSTDFINTLDDKVAAQDSKIEKIEASTSHITTKQNTKIAALQTRMSEFTSLKDGSTTGDAELIDARIGADGTKYPSAGDAMRGQVEQLNDALRADIDVERKRIDVLNNGGLIIKDELIERNIKTWLDEHPEATTTVQDGSITEKKLDTDLATKITDLQNSTKTYVNVNDLSISEIIDKYNEGAIPYIPNNITFSGEKLKSVKRFAGDGILITHQYIQNNGVKERGGIFTPSMYDNNFARDVNFFSEKESAIKLGHQKTGWLWGGENLFTDASRPLLVPWGQVMKNPDCDLTENVKIYIGNLRVVAHHTNGTFSCIFNDPFDGCMLLPIYESSPDELIYKSLGYENGFRTIELTPTELENFCLHFYTGKASQTYYINRPDDCDWIAYKFSVFSDTIENTLLFNGGCDIKTNDGSDTKEIGGARTLFVKNTPRDICFTNCPVDNLYYKVIDDIFENVVVSKRISVLDSERHIFNGFNVSDTSTSTFKFTVAKNKAYLMTACEVGNGIPNTDNSRAYIFFIGDTLKSIQIGGATDKFYTSASYSNNVMTITVPTKYCIVSLTKL